jgi:hypothetical protein
VTTTGGPPPQFKAARSGRDLFILPQNDRLNDQFRFIDTLILSMTDTWDYLPPRAKHILWLKLASQETASLEEYGLPVEGGMLLHWSMWPSDLGDYAQAVSMRLSRLQLEALEPKNVAMASALEQAKSAERTAHLQIELAQHLIQLSSMGADTDTLSRLFSKNRHDKAAISSVIEAAEESMLERMRSDHRTRPSPIPPEPEPEAEDHLAITEEWEIEDDDEEEWEIEDEGKVADLVGEVMSAQDEDETLTPDEIMEFAENGGDDDAA